MIVDWQSDTTYVLCNDAKKEFDRRRVEQLLPRTGEFAGHLWFATSGTTATLPLQSKWVALSKEALLTSAAAVNSHLAVDVKDIWIHALPSFHVGGMGIWARAHLSGSRVVDCRAAAVGKWDPARFLAMAQDSGATLSALVPTQVYDLVRAGYRAPAPLRAIVVGGAALAPALGEQARQLGWQLLPSYGLSECASQVATASIGDKEGGLKILSHVEVACDAEDRVSLKSTALLTAYAFQNEEDITIFDPKQNGWLKTEDCGRLEAGYLSYLGRSNNLFKVSGEFVDIEQLESVLLGCALAVGYSGDIALFAKSDERLGHVIHLAYSGGQADAVTAVVDAFNLQVLPFARIRGLHRVEAIPRTPLGKVIRTFSTSLFSDFLCPADIVQ